MRVLLLSRRLDSSGSSLPPSTPLQNSALAAVLAGTSRASSGIADLRIGSVKSNIGHTEACAGLAGTIKAALCLHHATLVPSLHFREANPHIAFAAKHVAVQTAVEAWPEGTFQDPTTGPSPSPPLAGT